MLMLMLLEMEVLLARELVLLWLRRHFSDRPANLSSPSIRETRRSSTLHVLLRTPCL